MAKRLTRKRAPNAQGNHQQEPVASHLVSFGYETGSWMELTQLILNSANKGFTFKQPEKDDLE